MTSSLKRRAEMCSCQDGCTGFSRDRRDGECIVYNESSTMSTAVADDNWNSLVVCRELPELEELDGPPAARDPSARTKCIPYEGVCATSPVGRTYMGREKLDLFNHVSEDLTLDGKRQLCLDLCQESRGLALS